MNLDDIPYIPAFWQIEPSEPRDIRVVVLHAMQAPEEVDIAENLGAYFAGHPEITSGRRKASTHFGVDADSIGRYVPDENICYGAGGVNRDGLHIEHAGYSAQSTDEWLDPYGIAMLKLSAALTAALCARYDIPVVWLDDFTLDSDARGITDHATACRVYGGDHSDPGPSFPRAQYLAWVRNQEADMVIHEAQLRVWAMPTYIVDYTYLPANGSVVGGRTAHSTIVARLAQGHTGTARDLHVFCNGAETVHELPADGRTVEIPVPGSGLVSLVCDTPYVTQGRELWT